MSLPARRVATDAPPPEGPRQRVLRRAKRPLRSPGPPTTPAPTVRRRKKHHVGFAIFAAIVLGSMVLGIVTLNALLAQQSFRIDEAERRIEALSTEHLDLVHEQARSSAPGRIAGWARRNGMRLPDDIRSLHAFGGAGSPPAGVADATSRERDR